MAPRVTVGIPAYNAADTLRRAVESALAQSWPADLIHISDNASTDATPEIGRELATRHERVAFTRHDTSLGLFGNFGFVLRQAQTEYFMWLAADDYIEPTYVEKMLQKLEADPGTIACVSRARFVCSQYGTTRLAEGTYSLLSDTVSNLALYFSCPSDNTRIFALYRTRVLQGAFTPRYFHAFDFAIIAGTLLHGGRHMEVPEILMVRDETPKIAYTLGAHRDNTSMLGRLLPVLAMTVDLIRRQRVPLRWPVIKALLKINLEKHLEYALLYSPRYGKAIRPFLRNYVLWRLAPWR
jgi:glycosyltransferase involved in cell wall biosynthesis